MDEYSGDDDEGSDWGDDGRGMHDIDMPHLMAIVSEEEDNIEHDSSDDELLDIPMPNLVPHYQIPQRRIVRQRRHRRRVPLRPVLVPIRPPRVQNPVLRRPRGRPRINGQPMVAAPVVVAPLQQPLADLIGRDGTVWSHNEPPIGRRLARNIVAANPGGPKAVLLNDTSLLTIFSRMFTDAVIEEILRWTNKFATEMYNEFNALHNTNRLWKVATQAELKAVIGILLFAGVKRNKKVPIKDLYTMDPLEYQPFFGASMSRNRLQAILKFLRFDDRAARHARKAAGDNVPRAEPVHQFFETVTSSFHSLFEPYLHLTVDEMVLGYRGRCPFRVFMKGKPEKYGIKLWILVDARTSFVLRMMMYTGTKRHSLG